MLRCPLRPPRGCSVPTLPRCHTHSSIPPGAVAAAFLFTVALFAHGAARHVDGRSHCHDGACALSPSQAMLSYMWLSVLIGAPSRPLPSGRAQAARWSQILTIDNKTTVHGRTPFQPRYDGTDRWLQRVLTIKTRPPQSHLNGNIITTEFR